MPMNVTGATQSAKKRRQRIAGIGCAAAALQVTRQHLRLVILGCRPSKSLLARYKSLKAGQSKAANARRPCLELVTKIQ